MGRQFRDGRRDGLQPVQSLNPDEIRSFAALLEAMGRTSFGGRRLGEAFEVLKQMCFDRDCFVVGTFSGAMTVGKMGTLICRMIDREMIQAVVTTGALLAHGFSESIGCVHYKTSPGISDAQLYAKGYNRVYDTIEMEANLNHVEEVFRRTLDRISCEPALSSECITRELGRTLAETSEGEGMLKSAYLKGVPVYIPAFTDSEIGLDLSTWAMGRVSRRDSGSRGSHSRRPQLAEYLAAVPHFNPFLDLNSYTARIMQQKTLGIFTIGGGVPRNWAQQVGPYIDITNHRLGTKFKPPRFRYGVRICPEPDYWGGLSGCTYSEGVSWGKFMSPDEGGRFAEVLSDATLVWPLLLQGLLEELDQRESRGPKAASSASKVTVQARPGQ
jgi:deoxyhypusine synthase